VSGRTIWHTQQHTQQHTAIQIRAIEESLQPWSVEHSLNITWGKYAAGASLCQSPNDKGMMHSILHKLFKSSKYKYGDYIEPDNGRWRKVKRILKDSLDLSSFKSIWKCLCHAPQFLNKAFTQSSILSGFHKSGIISESDGKFNANTILSQCPQWRKLSNEDGEWLMQQLPHFYKMFQENGCLPEDSFAILNQRCGVDNADLNLDDFVTNRQLCLVLGKNVLTEYHRMRAEDKSSSKLNKEWRQEYNAGRSRSQNSRYKCVNGCSNGTNIVKCSTSRCNFRVCQAEICQAMLLTHGMINNHNQR
jgi:hypothetical protein